jgi:hypothetical protein
MRELTFAEFLVADIQPNETIIIIDGPQPLVITADHRVAAMWKQAAEDLKANPTIGTRH